MSKWFFKSKNILADNFWGYKSPFILCLKSWKLQLRKSQGIIWYKKTKRLKLRSLGQVDTLKRAQPESTLVGNINIIILEDLNIFDGISHGLSMGCWGACWDDVSLVQAAFSGQVYCNNWPLSIQLQDVTTFESVALSLENLKT